MSEEIFYPLETAAVICEDDAVIGMIGQARKRSKANAVKAMGSEQAEFL